MVQVDVFWSYGLSSGLALAAAPYLKKEPQIWVNKYFIAIVLWIAIFFAPSGIYLLWNFPYWETMFLARTKDSIPAWLVVIFAVTNITQGVLGYWVTYHFIKRGRMAAARLQTIWSHFAMLFILVFGWDGSGWKRFTYSGTGDDWYNNVPHHWSEFFSSPVFYTLLSMGALLIPSYSYLIWKWRSAGRT